MRERDWRIWFGSAVSVVWITGGVAYIAYAIGWYGFLNQGTDSLGSFLEGAFAPLAFLWLVIGLFIQQNELARNTEALRKTELNARQTTFFHISDHVRHQLGGIAGMLFISSKGPVGDGTFSDEELAEYWHRHAMGDNEVFARLFITRGVNAEEEFTDLFYGTAIRQRHTARYIAAFRRLLKLAAECDTDNIISDALKGTAHGLLYRRMKDYRLDVRAPVDS